MEGSHVHLQAQLLDADRRTLEPCDTAEQFAHSRSPTGGAESNEVPT